MFETLKSRWKKSQSKRRPKRKQARKNKTRQPLELKVTRRQVVAAFSGLGLLMLYLALPRTQWMPIEQIRIAGDFRHLDTQQLRYQLQPYLGQGFFSVDIKQVQEMVGAQPWIRDVSVRRVWPDQIRVSITEKQAYARWDSSHLLSTRGSIFKTDVSGFGHLPLIHGYEGRSVELLQSFSDLQERLAPSSIRVTSLHEDHKGALQLELDNSIRVILGSEDSDYKISQLLKIYPQQILPRVEQIEHIDFRYANGFAIGWKPEQQGVSAPKLG
jgi:cell division protein FtsQ